MKRLSKEMYYLNIAKDVAMRGTCLRRNYGAVIVKDDVIVATGYTGAPRHRNNCCDLGYCERQAQKIPSGQRYELCRSVHAEQNAIINAGREKCMGATLYLYGWDVENNRPKENPKPCSLCERFILNAGITQVKTYASLTKEDFTKIQESFLQGSTKTSAQFLEKVDDKIECILSLDVLEKYGESNPLEKIIEGLYDNAR